VKLKATVFQPSLAGLSFFAHAFPALASRRAGLLSVAPAALTTKDASDKGEAGSRAEPVATGASLMQPRNLRSGGLERSDNNKRSNQLLNYQITQLRNFHL